MKRGKNGQQIAKENVEKVEGWIKERDTNRDWDEYEFNGKINRTVLSAELDFCTSVCTQNGTVRSALNSAEERWYAFKETTKASHDAARERAEKRSASLSSSNSTLNQRVAELEAENCQHPKELAELKQRIAKLEAENRQYRKELDAYKKQQALIQGGAAGFKI